MGFKKAVATGLPVDLNTSRASLRYIRTSISA